MHDWYSFLIYSTIGLVVTGIFVNLRRVFNPRYFAGTFLAVMYITYVLRPFLAYQFGDGLTTLEFLLPGISYLIPQNLSLMAGLFISSVLCFALGYQLFPRSLRVDQPNHPNLNEQQQTFIDRAALLFIVVGYASFLVAGRGFMGYAAHGSQMERTLGGSGFINTTGYIELANYLVVSGAILYYATTNKLLFSFIVATPWMINQIADGYYRYMILVLCMGFVGVWLIKTRKKTTLSKRQALMVIPLALGAIFLIASMRGARNFWSQGLSFSDAVNKTWSLPIGDAIADLAGFEGTWYMARNMDYVQPKYGASIFYQYVIKLIPRILWHSKPYPGDFNWGTLVGYTGSPGLADSYVWWIGPMKGSIGYALEEWGWLGIPINFIFTGAFLAWMEKKTFEADQSPTWIATYAATYSLVIVLGRQDIFLAGLNQVLIFYIPYLLIRRWVNRPPRYGTLPYQPHVPNQYRAPQTNAEEMRNHPAIPNRLYK